MTTRTTITEEPPEEGQEGLHMMVISPEVFAAIPLPDEGTLVIGRSTKCEIQIEDPLASRQHARLHLGDALAIEDLGSANGTRVRDVTVGPGTPVAIAPGETIGIGSTVLIVQRSRWSPGPRRIWSHAHFEGRIREECSRAAGSGGRFALARLGLEGAASWTRVFPILAREIQPPHVFAAYAPNQYEVLLLGVDDPDAARLLERVRTELARIDVRARTGVAWFPRDGRSADALLAHANALLRPKPAHTAVPGLSRPSPAMQRLYDLAARAAAGNINVLILGETGVGKEVMARAIHRLSARTGKPMLTLNCAGLSETLIESELFGYDKGAFTGATQAKPGLLESAEGGTVFLDEIGEISQHVQARLLRVIENREVLRVGAVKTRPIDVRFVAATHRNLEADCASGRFRQDLYFRLNGITLTIPPLRERRPEIEELARIFLAQACQDACRPALRLSDEASKLLEGYAWPGNVRELKNVIERAVVLCEEAEIKPDHLPLEKLRPATTQAAGAEAPAPPLSDEPRAQERQRIVEALALCAGNQSRAAKMLGMPRRTFVSKLDAYGIPRPQKGRA